MVGTENNKNTNKVDYESDLNPESFLENLPLSNDFSNSFEIAKVLKNTRTITTQRGGLAENNLLTISKNPALENFKNRYKPIHEDFLDDL